MKLLLVLGFFGVPVFAVAGDGSVDVGGLLTAYGTAAPFAALCYWQMRKAQERNAELEAKLEESHQRELVRERELVSRVAPMFYDGARLYERGNERLAQGPASMQDVDALAQQVQALVRALDERPGTP